WGDLARESSPVGLNPASVHLSVDTHRNYLAETKTFLNFCVGKKWLRANPLAGVKGVGRRSHGKTQLRIDEARRWLNQALVLADRGDAGVVAALCALLMAMCASEITQRVVRDLDDDGQIIWVTDEGDGQTVKTEARRRKFLVPPVLQGYLKTLVKGKGPHELLFGTTKGEAHWRDWPNKNVHRINKLAGVQEVCAHSMRGLHASIARANGVTGAIVAGALGHGSEAVHERSYARREEIERGR